MIPLALNGKSDDGQLLAIIAYLRDTHQIPRERIKKDWFILFDNEDYSILAVCDSVSREQAQQIPKPKVRHPDIIVFDEYKKIKYVIELDGKSHYRYRPHSKNMWQKKEDVAIRNADYHFGCIPLIIIDILDMEYLEKSWFVHLDEELEKLGMLTQTK